MLRGDFVIVPGPRDYGKPRPAIIIQNDIFLGLSSVVVCLMTTALRLDARQFRLDVSPTQENGLRRPTQIMIDKITVVPVSKIGGVIGRADNALMIEVNRALAVMLGIA